MRLSIWSFSKNEKNNPFTPLIQSYLQRIRHFADISWRQIPPACAPLPQSPLKEKIILETEMQKKPGYYILLDERGREFNSRQFAHTLQRLQNSSIKQCIFVIGGALGFHPELREKVAECWCLSRLTFPHQMIPLILSEQIYRSYTLMQNIPYHY